MSLFVIALHLSIKSPTPFSLPVYAGKGTSCLSPSARSMSCGLQAKSSSMAICGILPVNLACRLARPFKPANTEREDGDIAYMPYITYFSFS